MASQGRLDLAVTDLGDQQLKNIADPIRVYSVEVGRPATAPAKRAPASAPEKSTLPRLSVHFHLAAALAQLGRLDEARSAVKAGLVRPTYALAYAKVTRAARSDHPTFWHNSSPFPKSCARPECPNNNRDRRLAAILVGGGVGYSRLMNEGEDETGTFSICAKRISLN
jgi:hypothetical protein